MQPTDQSIVWFAPSELKDDRRRRRRINKDDRGGSSVDSNEVEALKTQARDALMKNQALFDRCIYVAGSQLCVLFETAWTHSAHDNWGDYRIASTDHLIDGVDCCQFNSSPVILKIVRPCTLDVVGVAKRTAVSAYFYS